MLSCKTEISFAQKGRLDFASGLAFSKQDWTSRNSLKSSMNFFKLGYSKNVDQAGLFSIGLYSGFVIKGTKIKPTIDNMYIGVPENTLLYSSNELILFLNFPIKKLSMTISIKIPIKKKSSIPLSI